MGRLSLPPWPRADNIALLPAVDFLHSSREKKRIGYQRDGEHGGNGGGGENGGDGGNGGAGGGNREGGGRGWTTSLCSRRQDMGAYDSWWTKITAPSKEQRAS